MRRVLMLATPIVLALSLAVPVSVAEFMPEPGAGSSAEPSSATCSNFCTMIYEPVTCGLSDGETMTFSNGCAAESYACEHGLQVVGCVARRGSVVS